MKTIDTHVNLLSIALNSVEEQLLSKLLNDIADNNKPVSYSDTLRKHVFNKRTLLTLQEKGYVVRDYFQDTINLSNRALISLDNDQSNEICRHCELLYDRFIHHAKNTYSHVILTSIAYTADITAREAELCAYFLDQLDSINATYDRDFHDIVLSETDPFSRYDSFRECVFHSSLPRCYMDVS